MNLSFDQKLLVFNFLIHVIFIEIFFIPVSSIIFIPFFANRVLSHSLRLKKFFCDVVVFLVFLRKIYSWKNCQRWWKFLTRADTSELALPSLLRFHWVSIIFQKVVFNAYFLLIRKLLNLRINCALKCIK